MHTNVIRILPESLANQIAAGEVVERPASVVKELVENAVDADADRITIVIRNAGKSLIQVIDNGNGMSPDDAILAFERHATSKIANIADLEHLATMGFRGEALPSIASVAQVELITRTSAEELATQVFIDNSTIKDVTKTAAEIGTSISVKNLFFNVPARKHFLKTNATEFNHISTMLKRFFLAHPDIAFTLYHDQTKVYDLDAASAEKRIRDVLGTEFFSGMLQVEEAIGDIQLYGYVLKPDMARYSKGQQFLFVNQRLIQSKYLHHAITSAYGHSIERSQYPGYCLFLSIDPAMIDINVHPTKMEVRFTNDRMIYNLFVTSVKKALNVDPVVPELSTSNMRESRGERPRENGATVIRFEDLKFQPDITFGSNKQRLAPAVPNQARLEFTYTPKDVHIDDRLQPRGTVTSHPEKSELQSSGSDQVALWQIHNRYILSQIKSGLVIIDQHVAHERILYERILRTLRSGSQSVSQQLLFPQTVQLTPEDFAVYEELDAQLNQIGYSIKAFSGNTVVIDAIPNDIKIGNEVRSLLEILDYHTEHLNDRRQPDEQMAAAFSCRNAIKSGERLSQIEMQSLIDQLFATSTPYFCPHGRPIIITISLDELDRKFKRT